LSIQVQEGQVSVLQFFFDDRRVEEATLEGDEAFRE
jgi:hypothetical protein